MYSNKALRLPAWEMVAATFRLRIGAGQILQLPVVYSTQAKACGYLKYLEMPRRGGK